MVAEKEEEVGEEEEEEEAVGLAQNEVGKEERQEIRGRVAVTLMLPPYRCGKGNLVIYLFFTCA